MVRLLIGYGNPLRCDDGVGWFLADECRSAMNEAAGHIIAAHQLTPEMAEPVSRAREVLFIDASATANPGVWTVQAVKGDPQESLSTLVHHLTPATLLTLSQVLYGVAPVGQILTVGGAEFGFGETLSGAVRAALPSLRQYVVDFLNGRL